MSLTQLQLRALCAANMADPRGGLHYTVGGWIDPDRPHDYHPGQTTTQLVAKGLLAETGKGKNRRRMITAEGRARMARETR